MPKANGVVTAIEAKSTQTGKKYYRVQVAGTWYSTWDYPKFSTGDNIEFDVVQKGDFKNLANAVVTTNESDSGSGNPALASQRNSGPTDVSREARILRQNAFSTAATIVAASKLAGKSDVATIFETTLGVAKLVYDLNMNGFVDPVAKEAAKEGKEANADGLFDY